MRAFRFIVTSLAVAAGLIGALAMVTMGFAGFVLLRLFGRPASLPRFRVVQRGQARPAYSSRDEVVDITATRVND